MNKSEFASADLTVGQLNAIVKKLGGHEGALRFLRGETLIAETVKKWRENNDIIYFSVTSDGTTGKEWVKRLTDQRVIVHSKTVNLLNSKKFKPTSGVTTKIAILKGKKWTDEDRFNLKVCTQAIIRNFTLPNLEIACLIRDTLSYQDIAVMGLLQIIVVDNPSTLSANNIFDLVHYQKLNVCRLYHVSGSIAEFDVLTVSQDYKWDQSSGFAFIVSQTSGS